MVDIFLILGGEFYMGEQKHYHSRLLDLSLVFDGVIQVLKSSYVDEKYNNWLVWLLLSPFRDISKLQTLTQGIFGFFSSSIVLALIPFLSGALGPVLFYTSKIDATLSVIIGYVIGYLFSLIFYFPMILQFKSGHFHTGAYKTFRRQEYELFKGAFFDHPDDFYFKGLYDYFGVQLSNNREVDRIYSLVDDRLNSYLQSEKQDLLKQISSLQGEINEKDRASKKVLDEFDDFANQLVEERDEILKGIEYVIDLIKDINTVLFRMKNGLFTKRDLNFVSGFTLYEKSGDVLKCIEDVGTTGATPTTIPLKSKKYKDWACVKVVNENLSQPVFNQPYENHVIVSFQMRMDQNATWVYNFHFDSDDKRAWSLLINDDIIESREVYRLIHAFCLILQDAQMKLKEAAR